MSQQSLTDLLGDITKQFGDRMEAVKEGRAPANAWDGPPMPLSNEYRVKVDTSTYQPSKAGKNQFVLTYEIQEPEEFAGRKVQAYYNPAPTNEAGSRQLADLFASLKAKLDGWGDDFEGFAAQFVGTTAVVTLDTWGDEEDRYGIRWINADRGQTLKTDIKPKVKKKSTSGLSADIQIPKNDAPASDKPIVSPPEAQAETPATPAVSPPSGPNLPPGLRS